jgi:hypothetical protein
MLENPPSELGIVRLVTTVAKHALGMSYRSHLREALGFGGIFFMAAPAEVCHIGQLGHVGGGVVSVLGQRTMTGLAGDIRMLALAMRLGFRIVTEEALAVPSVGDGASADHLECAPPVMSIHPKVLRHYDSPDEQEDREARK